MISTSVPRHPRTTTLQVKIEVRRRLSALWLVGKRPVVRLTPATIQTPFGSRTPPSLSCRWSEPAYTVLSLLLLLAFCPENSRAQTTYSSARDVTVKTSKEVVVNAPPSAKINQLDPKVFSMSHVSGHSVTVVSSRAAGTSTAAGSGTKTPAQPGQVSAPRADCGQNQKSSRGGVPGPSLCAPSVSVSNAETFVGPNTVELRVLVDKNGTIISVQPISGNPALYQSAVKAVNDMKFKPRIISRRAVKTEMIVKYVEESVSK